MPAGDGWPRVNSYLSNRYCWHLERLLLFWSFITNSKVAKNNLRSPTINEPHAKNKAHVTIVVTSFP